jgi:rhomboid protease GluP
MGMATPAPPSASRPAPVVLAVVAICALLETVFTLTGGMAGSGALRRQAFVLGAFWPGLLSGWEPVWRGQPAAMFLTYSLLHGGLMHMIFNMLILVHLSRETVARVGSWGFLLIYAVTSAGGGVAFWLMSSNVGPMVGASGAVFGLFGATSFWDYQRRRALRASLGPVWRLALGLVAMNVILYLLVGGYLAWQAHLGGFVAGWGVASIVTPTLTHRFRGGFR